MDIISGFEGRKAEIDGEREKGLQKNYVRSLPQKAQVIKGKADAEAIKTYAAAFNKGS